MADTTLPYVLIKPVNTKPRAEMNCLTTEEGKAVDWTEYFQGHNPEQRTGLVFDLETTGIKAHDPTEKVVAVGFSDERGSLAIDLRGEGGAALWQEILLGLHTTQVPLTAYNLSFDAAWLLRDFGRPLTQACTHYFNFYLDAFAIHRHLATEDFFGQRWGLKESQVNLLGWDVRGDKELDEELIELGYFKNYKGQKRPQHKFISRVSGPILTKYCALDCESTWQLLTHVFFPVMDKFPQMWQYEKWFMNEIVCTAWGQLTGIRVDRKNLQKHKEWLEKEIEEKATKFLSSYVVADHVKEFNQAAWDKKCGAQPEEWITPKIQKEAKEPPKFKKNGEISQKWEKWDFNRRDGLNSPRKSKKFLNWQAKKALPAPMAFNLGSGDHLRWLFYTKLKYPVLLYTKNKTKPLPAVDKSAMLSWGEEGKALAKLSKMKKELTFVSSVLEKSEADGRMHPQFKTPGTTTGRLGGSGGFNWQNPVKSEGLLSSLIPDEGMVLLSADYMSLEPVMMAECSGDPASLTIYGKGAKPNDIYLFVGAHIPGFAEKYKAEGYDPYNPTKEAIAACKKKYKSLRSLNKIQCLSADYGCGANKWHSTMTLLGYKYSLEEVQRFHKAFWELFKGKKRWAQFLQAQWEKSGGYILNGIGRPIAIAEERTRDNSNACVQSSGHDCLVLALYLLVNQLEKEGIVWLPFILDFHDEFIIQVRANQRKRAEEIVQEVQDELNKLLNPRHVTFKLSGGQAAALDRIKLENNYERYKKEKGVEMLFKDDINVTTRIGGGPEGSIGTSALEEKNGVLLLPSKAATETEILESTKSAIEDLLTKLEEKFPDKELITVRSAKINPSVPWIKTENLIEKATEKHPRIMWAVRIPN